MRIRRRPRSAFTLVELLVVMLIILIVSAAALPTIVDAWTTRRLRDASAIVHSTLSMTRSLAAASPIGVAGVRLIPDEKIAPNRVNADGVVDPSQPIDPTLPLVYSRMVALTFPPPYEEGKVMIRPGEAYPATPDWYRRLVIEEAVYDEQAFTVGGKVHPEGRRNAPTSWYWNVRIGDKIVVEGFSFFICGPAVIPPGPGNPEGFVNVGPPGVASPLVRFPNPDLKGNERGVEFLLVTNGLDDDGNGFVDDGWDGIDNDLDSPGGTPAYQRPDTRGEVPADNGVDEPDEREPEAWPQIMATRGVQNGSYRVLRKPYPDPHKTAVQLPESVVIDANWWGERPRVRTDPDAAHPGYWRDDWGCFHPLDHPWDYTKLRSILPVDAVTGEVDLIFDSEGVGTAGPYAVGMPSSLYDQNYRIWIGGVEDVGVNPHDISDAYVLTINRKNGLVVAEQFDLDAIKGSKEDEIPQP